MVGCFFLIALSTDKPPTPESKTPTVRTRGNRLVIALLRKPYTLLNNPVNIPTLPFYCQGFLWAFKNNKLRTIKFRFLRLFYIVSNKI